jgi:hypothetical protein
MPYAAAHAPGTPAKNLRNGFLSAEQWVVMAQKFF